MSRHAFNKTSFQMTCAVTLACVLCWANGSAEARAVAEEEEQPRIAAPRASRARAGNPSPAETGRGRNGEPRVAPREGDKRIPIARRARSERYQAEGICPASYEYQDLRFEVAVQDAREALLEEFAADVLDKYPDLTQSRFYDAFLFTAGRQTVTDIKVIDETRAETKVEDDKYVIEASIDRRKLEEMCRDFTAALGFMPELRVIVWCDEWTQILKNDEVQKVRVDAEQDEGASIMKLKEALGAPSPGSNAAMEIERTLRRYNYQVRVRNRFEFLKAHEKFITETDEDRFRLREVERDFGAEFYVVGHAIAHHSSVGGGTGHISDQLSHYGSSSRCQTFATASGELLAGMAPQSAEYASAFAGEKGAVEALSRTGQKLGWACLEQLVLSHIKVAKFGYSHTLRISRIADDRVPRVKQLLKELKGPKPVLDVKEMAKTEGVVRLAVRSFYDRETLLDILRQADFDGYTLRVATAQSDSIDAEFAKRD